jgi:hypothetical protein
MAAERNFFHWWESIWEMSVKHYVGFAKWAQTLDQNVTERDGQISLVADGPEQFADDVVLLYQDEALWNIISHNGLEFAENAWGAEAAWKILSDITVDLGISNQRSECKLSLYSNDVVFATSRVALLSENLDRKV